MSDKTINERVSLSEQSIKNLKSCYEDIRADVKDIKDNLLKRPSWSVTIIITGLSSICIGLIVRSF